MLKILFSKVCYLLLFCLFVPRFANAQTDYDIIIKRVDSLQRITISGSSLDANVTAGLRINGMFVTALSGAIPIISYGTDTISGTLTIRSFRDMPFVGQRFTIFASASLHGTFSPNPVLPPGYTGTISYNGTQATLTITGIPTSGDLSIEPDTTNVEPIDP